MYAPAPVQEQLRYVTLERSILRLLIRRTATFPLQKYLSYCCYDSPVLWLKPLRS